MRAVREDWGSESLGSLVSALMLFVLGIMALGQLKIDTEIVRVVTTCLLAGIEPHPGLGAREGPSRRCALPASDEE